MVRFQLKVMDRKILAQRIGELTGVHPFYIRGSKYAYEIGAYTIDRDNFLTVGERNINTDILQNLMVMEEGLIEWQDLGVIPGQSRTVEAKIYGSDLKTKALGENYPEKAAEAAVDNNPGENEEIDLDMNFSLPMRKHTGTSLRNLLHLIYSRGSLIRKSTGGIFTVTEGLISAIKDDRCVYSVANFLRAVADYEGVHGPAIEGLTMTPETVSFCGFPTARDVEHLTAYGHLAVLMNQQAISQKRIQAKTVDESNERYAMRIWLIRLGMNGDDFKQSRKLLMENLKGNMAFRSEDQVEQARARNAQKRAALKGKMETEIA